MQWFLSFFGIVIATTIFPIISAVIYYICCNCIITIKRLKWLSVFHRENKQQEKSRFPKCTVEWQGLWHVIVHINHPDVLEQVHQVLEKPSDLEPSHFLLRPWLGNGIILSNGGFWRHCRPLLEKTTYKCNVFNRIVSAVDEFCDHVCKPCKPSLKDPSIEMFRPIELLVSDILLKCALSIDVDLQSQKDYPYWDATQSLHQLINKRMSNKLLHNDVLYSLTGNGRMFHNKCELLHFITRERLDHTSSSLTSVKSCDWSRDLLESVDTAEGLEPHEVREQLDNLIFAGSRSTSAAIVWTLHCLSLPQNRTYVTRCCREVDEILQNTVLSMDKLNHFDHVTSFINESLRYHSPVRHVMRVTSRDMYIDGRFVPSKTCLKIHIDRIHKNPDVWREPAIFNPDRISGNRFSCVPFYIGERNCLGEHMALMLMKIFVIKFLSRFHFRLDTSKSVEKSSGRICTPTSGLHLFLRHRAIDKDHNT